MYLFINNVDCFSLKKKDISADDSYRENSDEENSNEEN